MAALAGLQKIEKEIKGNVKRKVFVLIDFSACLPFLICNSYELTHYSNF